MTKTKILKIAKPIPFNTDMVRATMGGWKGATRRVIKPQPKGNAALRDCPFCRIWDSTIKKSALPLYGWNANPWVWVYEFKKVEVDT